MRTMLKTAAIGSLLLSGSLTAFADNAATPSVAATSASQPGTWQKHKYSLVFMGFTTTYSCDGLADKVQLLLISAGARPDAKSRPGACANGFGRPDKFARAELTFYTLVPNDAAPASNGAPINGVWRQVAFADRRPMELKLGDCELIEQFRDHVLPFFSTRAVADHTTCVPNQLSGSNIDLQFQSFTAVPPTPAPR